MASLPFDLWLHHSLIFLHTSSSSLSLSFSRATNPELPSMFVIVWYIPLLYRSCDIEFLPSLHLLPIFHLFKFHLAFPIHFFNIILFSLYLIPGFQVIFFPFHLPVPSPLFKPFLLFTTFLNLAFHYLAFSFHYIDHSSHYSDCSIT